MKTTTILLALSTTGLLAMAYAATAKPPQVKLTIIIRAPIEPVFNYIVPVDLPHIFKRYGSLPAITGTSIKEVWNKPGLSRTIYFDDGSTSKETLLTVVPHRSFSYQNEEFTSQLRFLAKRIDGSWQFTDLGNGETKVEWTYQVIPKNIMARGVINLVLLKNIRGYLTNALTILKNDLERNNTQCT